MEIGTPFSSLHLVLVACYLLRFGLSQFSSRFHCQANIWKALQRASERSRRYPDILSSTCGVTFLGTPFQGSHECFSDAADLRVVTAMAMTEGQSPNLVKFLRRDHQGEELDQLIQKFCEMVHHKDFNFPIACFYETLPTDFTKVKGYLPKSFTDCLGPKNQRIVGSLYANHFDTNSNLESLLGEIRPVFKVPNGLRWMLDTEC